MTGLPAARASRHPPLVTHPAGQDH